MAAKEKVDIKRNDQFQEMEDALSKAIEDLDCTMDRVAALFEGGEQSELAAGDAAEDKAQPEDAVSEPEDASDGGDGGGDGDAGEKKAAEEPEGQEEA